MQRIGLVLLSVPGYSETFFRSKIKGLQANGFEVVLFVFYPPKKDEHLPCKVIVSPQFNGNFFSKSIAVFKALLQILFVSPFRSKKLYQLDSRDGNGRNACFKNLIANQFIISEDLDWLHFGFGTVAVGRENLADAMHAKMAVSFRGFDLYLSPLKRNQYYNTLFKKDVKYHVLSQEMKVDLIAKGVTDHQIKVITPAINTLFFKPNTSSLANDKLKILTVARLHWKKGLEYTLEALALLVKRDISFEYTIIGTGDELERLVFAAHQLGISEYVKFIGKQSPETVKTYMSSSDIYLQYSIQEGFCNAVIEAQAMGLICVVSDAEGLAENVLNELTGFVIPKRKPKVLAETIEKLVYLPERQKNELKKLAIERVKKDFNISKQQDEFLEFYQN
ncbi:glycosyltransferase family 4 protein [Psychroserpens sp. Hel_I_66]|uniref:glycosyltransferase family 4 protein n=1 Tax=Psychroserpens sp. Hel_I_66 TaxID=1250004 RepID=UPI0012E03512|nr:glycosyltransferase family 4 protein [Psychroserpens sp. Hel_I_66]